MKWPMGEYAGPGRADNGDEPSRREFFAYGVQGVIGKSRSRFHVVSSKDSQPDAEAGGASRGATLTGALAPSKPLTAVDVCDRCGARAYVRVLLPGSAELLFCAHHARQHSEALAKVAVEIQDETSLLASTKGGQESGSAN
jgi:hypothetical protein